MRQFIRPVSLLGFVLAIAGCTATQGESPTSPASPPVPEAATLSPEGLPENGPVEPGTYHIPPSAWSVAGYTVTIPEGWHTAFGHGFGKHPDQAGELYFYPVIVDAIYDDPCHGEGELLPVGPSMADLVHALLAQPVVVVSEPVDTTLGGLPAKRVDLQGPDDLEAEACGMGEELQIWYSPPADKYFVLLGDGAASVYVLDVNGERQVFLTHHRAGTTADDLTELETVIDSIEIDS